ncbi:MAG: substrate-binding domain-containing protein [Chloroflexota bacterium]|nr:substrate-binding domain-containing protein [Chloroflexota bacterium]
MRRGRVFVILFIVAAAIVIGISQFLRGQPPLTVRFAVSPIAQAWIAQAATAFNSAENLSTGNQRISLVIEPVDDIDVWTGRAGWSASNHPDGWIAGADYSLAYAAERLPFVTVAPTTAGTLLVWGAFADRAAALTGDGSRPLDWDDVNRAADAGRWSSLGAGDPTWGNFVFAMHRPNRTLEGFAVALSAAADFADSPVNAPGSALVVPDFQASFENVILSVPNLNTLGATPAAAIAARNTSVGEVALLPESEWLTNLKGEMVKSENPIQFAYPAYNVAFNFPAARWNDESVTPDRADAVARFAAFLTTDSQQRAAQRYGLRPVSGEALDATFSAAAAYGIRVPLPDMNLVTLPPRDVIQRTLDWLNGLVR